MNTLYITNLQTEQLFRKSFFYPILNVLLPLFEIARSYLHSASNVHANKQAIHVSDSE